MFTEKSLKKVVFRVDASVRIGSGHVMRCLTLARALRDERCSSLFLCRDLKGNLIDYIRKEGFEVKELSAPTKPMQITPDNLAHSSWLEVSWQQDLKDCEHYLNEHSADLLVVDSYALDFRWEAPLRKYIKNIMVIDDLVDRQHECDYLLDQTLDRSKQEYLDLVPDDCVLFCGTEYALLRPEFVARSQAALERRKHFSGIKTVLVTMGGVDKDNKTGTVINNLEGLACYENCETIVVLSKQAPHYEQVLGQVTSSHLKITLVSDVDNMADLMLNADLAIGAAGSTSWERCCLALPTLMLILANNQRQIAMKLQARNAALLLDAPEDFEILISKFQNKIFYCQSWNNAFAICDGSGVEKIVLALL